jgi:hypothetical protein
MCHLDALIVDSTGDISPLLPFLHYHRVGGLRPLYLGLGHFGVVGVLILLRLVASWKKDASSYTYI